MGKIVVAKLYRLGKDGDKFSKQFKTPLRERVVIDEDYIKSFNNTSNVRGQMYEIDEIATQKRDDELKIKETSQETGEKSELNDFLEALTIEELKDYAGEMGITEDQIGSKRAPGIIKMIIETKG